MRLLSIFIVAVFPLTLFAGTAAEPIAEVIRMRGEATQLSPGAKIARSVAIGDKFVEDTSILTGPKSFIKIKFADSSEINLGPESKIVITEMKKESVGIISLLKGRIRTEVQKSAEKKDTNKFFIRTRTAAMGVRGTDFQTIYNPENKMTSLLTYKGEVAMAKVDEATFESFEQASETKMVQRDDVTKSPEIKNVPGKKIDEVEQLNTILKNKPVVKVLPGQNSFSSESLKKASLPVQISPVQLEVLYKNSDFQEKGATNLNIKDPVEMEKFKSLLKTVKQSAPVEGLYNNKTGDFAPKAGGFIDLNTGLYVAPDADAKLDPKTGVFVPAKVGDIDADTGQYIAPKGLILDAKKGFILESEADKRPEILAMKEDLNKTIARDIVVGAPAEKKEFNIDEKFIRDRLALSLYQMNQNLKSDLDLDIDSKSSVRFGLEWAMATENRFSPIVNLDYSIVDFKGKGPNITQQSTNLMALSFGTQYAMTKSYNLFFKVGLHQELFYDQTALSPSSYDLKRIVLTRLNAGANAELWSSERWSVEGSASALLTFRKRINNLVVSNGGGFILEALPKYSLSDRKWIGLGLHFEHQFQDLSNSIRLNEMKRTTAGLEIKYITDFNSF